MLVRLHRSSDNVKAKVQRILDSQSKIDDVRAQMQQVRRVWASRKKGTGMEGQEGDRQVSGAAGWRAGGDRDAAGEEGRGASRKEKEWAGMGGQDGAAHPTRTARAGLMMSGPRCNRWGERGAGWRERAGEGK